MACRFFYFCRRVLNSIQRKTDQIAFRKNFPLRVPTALQNSSTLKAELDVFIGNKLKSSSETSPGNKEENGAFTLSFCFKHRPSDRTSVQLMLNWLNSNRTTNISTTQQSSHELLEVQSTVFSPCRIVQQVLYKTALFLAHDLAIQCYDRGVLFATLWNVYTEMVDHKQKMDALTFEESDRTIQELRLRTKRWSNESQSTKWNRFEMVTDWMVETERKWEETLSENEKLQKALFQAEQERDSWIRKFDTEFHSKESGIKNDESEKAQKRWNLIRSFVQCQIVVIKNLKVRPSQRNCCFLKRNDIFLDEGQENNDEFKSIWRSCCSFMYGNQRNRISDCKRGRMEN